MDHPTICASTEALSSGAAPKRRMGRDEREAMIVETAVQFFAERGLEGNTRDLAKRAGITQPLLYRYFPNKESLIERVYDQVYLRRWRPEWGALIKDRSRSLEERMIQFYTEYSEAVYDYVWVRIFMYSGLKGGDLHRRYLALIRRNVLAPVCEELRHENNLPDPASLPISDEELEFGWALHGAFFYRAVRWFVYDSPSTVLSHAVIENDVRTFFRGAPGLHKALVEGRRAV